VGVGGGNGLFFDRLHDVQITGLASVIQGGNGGSGGGVITTADGRGGAGIRYDANDTTGSSFTLSMDAANALDDPNERKTIQGGKGADSDAQIIGTSRGGDGIWLNFGSASLNETDRISVILDGNVAVSGGDGGDLTVITPSNAGGNGGNGITIGTTDRNNKPVASATPAYLFVG